MSGALLVNDGDVQIGVDGSTYVQLLRRRKNDPNSAAWASSEFNPVTDIELATSDSPLWGSRGGLRSGYDVPQRRRVEFDVIVAAPPNAASRQAGLDAINAVARNLSAHIGLMSPDQEDELAFKVGALNYVMYGRYRSVTLLAPTTRFGRAHARYRVRFEATDPWIYECTVRTSTFTAAGGVDAQGVYNSTEVQIDSSGKPAISTGHPSLSFTTNYMLGGNAPPRYTMTVTGTKLYNPVIYDLRSKFMLWAIGVSPILSTVTFRSRDRKVIGSANEGWCTGWPTLHPVQGTMAVVLVPRTMATLGTTTSASATLQVLWQRGWTGI